MLLEQRLAPRPQIIQRQRSRRDAPPDQVVPPRRAVEQVAESVADPAVDLFHPPGFQRGGDAVALQERHPPMSTTASITGRTNAKGVSTFNGNRDVKPLRNTSP